MAEVVRDLPVPEAGVGVELRLPLTDKRIDVSFVASDKNNNPHVVLVELKQWNRAEPSAFPKNVLVGGREFLHPPHTLRSHPTASATAGKSP